MMHSSVEDVSLFVRPDLHERCLCIVWRPDTDHHQSMVLAHCICEIIQKICRTVVG
jgi:hypothetical protein